MKATVMTVMRMMTTMMLVAMPIPVRYFGEGREKPRVKIFRDQAAWCPYCQKVWLMLEEKRVDYETVKVPMRSYGDKPQSFLKLIPNGLLPAMEIDGRLMTESLDIMVTIERTFPDPDKPMIPPAGPLLDRAQQLLGLERKLFGAWCGYMFRPEVPFLGGGDGEFTSVLEQVDRELGSNTESPFFLPYAWPTLVDMQYVSHVERAVASAMFYKGYDVRKRFPNIDSWLSAYEALPHYMATKSDYYTHCMDIPRGTHSDIDSDLAREARSAIEPGSARASAPLDSELEPLTAQQRAAPEEHFRVEAAWSLVQNHEAVARFCCRAAGSGVGDWASGNPTKCRLADPYATPAEEMLPSVEAALRSVAAALLRGDPAVARAAREAAEAEVGAPPGGWPLAAACLEYLRDRVGSPRDLSMPAAKLLRGYLNEAVASLRA
ncbi:unnamed protein product [Prorocentrum cordatum]|uniref:GST N-terminal domain-containing protein n=1 Tax=Prorocentrum cordatum TaxID=2364126 RepID=A0ABN9R6Z0_9DINO|nr:unnamed protein product [Polarella glacialis]